MKTRNRNGIIALAAVAIVGAGAGTAMAQGDDAPLPAADGAERIEFICANLEQIQQLQVDRAALIGDRLELLQEERAFAEGNGNPDAVARIDRRIERVTEHRTKVAERQESLTTLAAERCTG